jgi:hypothetical protein
LTERNDDAANDQDNEYLRRAALDLARVQYFAVFRIIRKFTRALKFFGIHVMSDDFQIL